MILRHRVALSRPQLMIARARAYDAWGNLGPARHRIVVAGRRFGKTTEALSELFASACVFPGSENWYLAPTRKMAKDIAWAKLKKLVPAAMVKSVSESELALTLINGGVIKLHGTENFDALRGRGVRLVVFDEFAFMKPGVWPAVRPVISDKTCPGRTLFIGTPHGYNEFKKLYDRAVDGRPGWWAMHFTTLDGGNVDQAEIADAQRDLDARAFRQEYMATFESVEGRIIHAFLRKQFQAGNLDSSIHDLGGGEYGRGPLWIGMDFNVNPMTATFSSRADTVRTWPQVGALPMQMTEVHTWGELVLRDANTETMMAEIRRRYPHRQLLVFPDPTGGARSTSADLDVTNFTIIRKFGAHIFLPHNGTYAIQDKYNTWNSLCSNSLGVRRQLINPQACPNLVEAADGLCYKAGTNQPDKSMGLDHIIDAHGYKLLGAFPLAVTGVHVQEMVF